MYLNFVTTYNKEHAPLEDFQPHRQVMGVHIYIYIYILIYSFLLTVAQYVFLGNWNYAL